MAIYKETFFDIRYHNDENSKIECKRLFKHGCKHQQNARRIGAEGHSQNNRFSRLLDA